MGIRVGELDTHQQERLRAALGETLAAHFAYPSFYSFGAERSLVRPLDRPKRTELASYVATIGFAPLERMEVDSPELRRYFEGVFLRYLDINPQLVGPRMAGRTAQLRALARAQAASVQRDLVTFLQGSAPGFGTPRPASSWADVFARVAPRQPAPTEPSTDVLEAILARAQQQPQPARPAARPAPRPAVRPRSDAIQVEVTRSPAEAPGNPADDRLVFAQLRYQIESYIRRAVESYGLPDRGGDPARALDDLRTSGLVDEANLGVAENILALTDRVMARGSATVDEYRQALTLYLLYHRIHLHE